MTVSGFLWLLIHGYVLWELWTGTSRIALRSPEGGLGGHHGQYFHVFYRNSEDGSGYFWMSWVFKAGMLAIFWFQDWLHSV